jgi:hypothetical protein
MKRNEAVLIIAECLIEPHFPDDALKESHYILKRLEKIGMIPPIRERTEEEKTNPKYEGINWGKYIREWESE